MTSKTITVEVECSGSGAAGTPRCSAAGQRREVALREAAPGIVESPTLLCAACGCAVLTVTGWPVGVAA